MKHSILIILITTLFFSCGKEIDKENDKNVPFLSTIEAFEITFTTATSGGNIIDDGGAAVTERGVCWSTSHLPTTDNDKTIDGKGAGSFKSTIYGLKANTKYYARAYATNSIGTQYGNQVEFTTDDPWKIENWKADHEAQFAKISADATYTKIESQSKKGYIMYKKIKDVNSTIKPNLTDKVSVLYTGWFKRYWTKDDTFTGDDGNIFKNKVIFDSTADRNDIPSTFTVNGVMDGISTALQHMNVGDKGEIWIPWQLGYGESGRMDIRGYTTLVFELELLAILK